MANNRLISLPLKLFSIWLLSCLVVLGRQPFGALKMTTTTKGAGNGWSSSTGQSIDAIYQFGDSISDTGNWMREDKGALCSTFPYGESYFHFATGRCSDGLIMTDFYAMAFGLQLLNPYLWEGANFSSGVDFAVGGATALDAAFLESKDIRVTGTNSSLSVQLDWFRNHLKSICNTTTECKSKLGRSLVFMEAMGGVDYDYVLSQYSPIQTAYDLVPAVVQAIMGAVKELINLGVGHVVVPSVFPLGCIPYYLTLVRSKAGQYDDLGCYTYFNELSEYHNQRLQKAIQDLQMIHPNVTLMYGDYYYAITSLLKNATDLGFQEGTNLITCCGRGNDPYNFNTSEICGKMGVPVCPRPKTRVVWDGYHFTQQFYMYLSKWMLENTIFPRLSSALSL